MILRHNFLLPSSSVQNHNYKNLISKWICFHDENKTHRHHPSSCKGFVTGDHRLHSSKGTRSVCFLERPRSHWPKALEATPVINTCVSYLKASIKNNHREGHLYSSPYLPRVWCNRVTKGPPDRVVEEVLLCSRDTPRSWTALSSSPWTQWGGGRGVP
ncbi:hypothetical protein CDAR_539001 [Caerostris darwini]|uniref:Uncharacterized protein n=1 Tax=Caerostris darwini TaxID=1538125 RepID=A0AAV4T6I3_9ARAC|nr:hypothetical protein CDAR_539001 [Caerostris darwini]